MIIVTGAAGFIGSVLVAKLNEEGYEDIILVDKFDNLAKNKNLKNKKYSQKVDRNVFFDWLDENHNSVQFIFHIGARTDTAEFDYSVLEKLNLNYSKKIWEKSVRYGLPMVYASSAATYGGGEFGYNDAHTEIIKKLKPLNPYGISKNEFDKWALEQDKKPYFWIGLKFFNVYGPNEYHKGRMASVIMHAHRQIKETGQITLFKSHKEGIKNGEQKRDFVYVKDLVNVCIFFMLNRKKENNGIYNLGTGKAETFLTLTNAIFETLKVDKNIKFVPTPEDIRDKYQYFTQATMNKLKNIGYDKKFTGLEQGVKDYVKNYLEGSRYI